MEKNYVQAPVYPGTTTRREKHRPIQPKPKAESNYSFLLDLAGKVKLPFTFLSSMFASVKRTPIQHQRKDVPIKLRAAIGEKLTDIVEVECNIPGRVLFSATGKSGRIYEVEMRNNYGKIIAIRA